jgi:hypothetical protein
MAQMTGVIVDKIKSAGSTEHGEHIHLTVVPRGGKAMSLFFPFALFQQLVTAVIAGGSAAYRDQVRRLGSDENIVTVHGMTNFHPTGFELGRGQSAGGPVLILLRLKKDGVPVIDATFDFQAAAELGGALLDEVRKGPPMPPIRQ